MAVLLRRRPPFRPLSPQWVLNLVPVVEGVPQRVLLMARDQGKGFLGLVRALRSMDALPSPRGAFRRNGMSPRHRAARHA